MDFDEEEAQWAGVPRLIRSLMNERPDAKAVEEMMSGMTQEEKEACDTTGQTALHHACVDHTYLSNGVLEVVLDAMSCEGIMIVDGRGADALRIALREGKKKSVMLIAERQKQETDWNPFAVSAGGSPRIADLAISSLANDKEVVDLVLASTSADDLRSQDPLRTALESFHAADLLIDAILKRGPQIAESIPGTRLRYVCTAAERQDLAIVKKMLEHVSVQQHDGRRASVEEFANAVVCGAGNFKGMKLEVMEYLAEEAGSEVFDHVPALILEKLWTAEEMEWVLSRAPHLLLAAAKSGTLLRAMVYSKQATDYLVEQTLQHVDHSVIGDMLAAGGFGRAKYWRKRVRRLFEEVPEREAGAHWRGLMLAISCNQTADIDFMATLCPRADLSLRDRNGDTAADLARKNKWIKEEVVARLTVEPKSAVE